MFLSRISLSNGGNSFLLYFSVVAAREYALVEIGDERKAADDEKHPITVKTEEKNDTLHLTNQQFH